MGNLATFLVATHIDIDRGFALWERALALDPRLSEVRTLYAVWGLGVLRGGCDNVQVEQELRRAVADDPRNPICSTVFAMGFGILGRPLVGAAEVRRACEIDPAAFAPRYALAWCLTWARETEEAMKVVEGAIEQFGRHPWLLQVLTGLYMQRDDRTRAEAVHAELEARAVTSTITFYTRAVSALYLGRVDEAVEHALRSAELKDALGPIWYRWPDIEALPGRGSTPTSWRGSARDCLRPVGANGRPAAPLRTARRRRACASSTSGGTWIHSPMESSYS